MKKSFSIIFMLVIAFQLGSVSQVIAAPGDTLAEAIPANLGMNNGTMTLYNEVDFYNFSGNYFRTYNFTLYIPENDYLSLYIYDADDNLIDKNFTGVQSKSLILTWEDDYIIRIFSSEFAVFPAVYSLVISEVIPDPKEGVASADKVGLGEYTDTFTLYNDVHWYNFTGSVSKEYNFTVYRNEAAYIGLYIYDSNLELLAKNSTQNLLNEIILSGHDHYVIAVYSSEFIELPVDYTLTIAELNQISSTSAPISSSSSTNEPETSTQSAEGFNFDNIDFPWLLLIPSLIGFSFFRKMKRNF